MALSVTLALNIFPSPLDPTSQKGALPGLSVPHLCVEDTLKVFPLKLESQGESGLCARLLR